jgi:hypothetical protein
MRTTLKINLAILCVSLTFLLYAEKPTSQQKANNTIGKIAVDVQLTDSQKTILGKYAEEYYMQIENANSIQDRHQMIDKKNELVRVFTTKCDSILSKTQKETIVVKRQERKNKKNNK